MKAGSILVAFAVLRIYIFIISKTCRGTNSTLPCGTKFGLCVLVLDDPNSIRLDSKKISVQYTNRILLNESD